MFDVLREIKPKRKDTKTEKVSFTYDASDKWLHSVNATSFQKLFCSMSRVRIDDSLYTLWGHWGMSHSKRLLSKRTLRSASSLCYYDFHMNSCHICCKVVVDHFLKVENPRRNFLAGTHSRLRRLEFRSYRISRWRCELNESQCLLFWF